MNYKSSDESLIKAYLLGKLAEEDRRVFEERMMADDELYDQVLLAEDEMVEDYALGRLRGKEKKSFEANFLSSQEGREQLSLTSDLIRLASNQSSKTPAPAIKQPLKRKLPFSISYAGMLAAAIIVIAAGLGVWRLFLYESEVEKGTAALRSVYRDRRPLESRLTGFDYAPPATMRSGDQGNIDKVARDRAERILLDAVTERPGSGSHHAAGQLYLSERNFDEAIRQFEAALKADPQNARAHSDLGAALMERGKIARSSDEPGRSLEEFAKSLEHLTRALELDNSLREALFNRALLYEYMNLPQQAEEGWKDYLETDSDSPWSDEARRHLNELEEKKRTGSQNKGDLLTDFVAAYQAKRDDRAYELMSKNTQAITGQLVWWVLLDAYLDLSLRGEHNEARERLRAFLYAGELQEQKMGDRFVLDLARFYQKDATASDQASLAQAHTFVNQAHSLLARSDTDKAIELYQKAKAVFDKTGARLESRYSQYWIGYSLYRKSNFKKSLLMLSEVAEYARRRSYLWLLECALTMIANIHGESNQFSKSLAFYKESLKISEEINDEYNTQRNLTSLAYGYKNLGDRKESLAYMHRCLQRAADFWPGARQMYRNLDTAAGILNSFGYYAAAAEYEKAALQQALEAKDPVFEHRSYTHLGAIYIKLQDYAEALRCAQRSYEVAKAMSGERADLRSVALSSMQLAHIYRQTQDYDKAAAHYDDSIRHYEEIDLFAYLYEARKGKLLCYIAQGDDSRAEEELQTVLAFFEEHRSKIDEEKYRNSFFDLEQYVYDIAIDFEHTRKRDYRKAFDYSEMSRARSLLDLMSASGGMNRPDATAPSVSQPLMLNSIQEKIPEKAQIVQYALLDDKLVIWVISRTRFEATEKKITLSSLTEKALDYWQSISLFSESRTEASRNKAIELYQIVIAPVESLLEKDKQICIVPDKALHYLPFNALISPVTGRYLVDDYLLSFAPSANTFLLCSEEARKRSGDREERVLSVGDPHFDRDAFPSLSDLPSSGREAKEVSRCYRSTCCLVGEQATTARVISEMAKADVIHLASHYVIDERDALHSKLLLTGEARGDSKGRESNGVLHAYDIHRKKLPLTRLVVLSACQTGIEQYYKGEGMIGMSRTFLTTGVPLVAASLWPVDSELTADLMINFHKYRKQGGLSSAEALRQAQLDMIGSGQSQYDQPYYWAPFIIIGGHAIF